MLVTEENIDAVFRVLLKSDELALDTETSGLRVHHSDSLFSIVVSTHADDFYFNFNHYPGVTPLDREHVKKFNFLNHKMLFMANAKFDMHMMAKEGVEFRDCQIWDVLVMAKCLNNTHMQYGLGAVAGRMGYEKLGTVEEYIAKHKLFTISQQVGKKTRTKNPHYDLVPLEIMQPYAERDSRITFDIGAKQIEEVETLDVFSKENGYQSFKKLIEREMKVTQVCYEIERTGMSINREHISIALAHEQAQAVAASNEFTKITNTPFVDSNKSLKQAFTLLDISGGTTKKGNPSFTDEVLSQITHPLGETIRNYRDAYKRANTYYQSFLAHADSGGIIHPSIRQTGADTFRFSITDPALQTLNSKETGEFKIRSSFVARDGDYLVAIDYAQQEYRLAADYAGEMELIAKIKSGIDVHTATAELMGVGRDAAKTLNFMLLYGGGVAKLCIALFDPRLDETSLKAIVWKYIYKSWPREKAESLIMQAAASKLTQEDINHDLPLLQRAHGLQQQYFSALPRTKAFIDKVTTAAKERGYIYNWAGRRLLFPNKRFAYKAPNHLIQSSGAEIMRCALVELYEFLKPYKTKLLLSVHDEILFNMPPEEFDLIPKIREIMRNVYKPFNGLMMDTSVSYGLDWGNMKKEQPDVTKARNSFSGESAGRFEVSATVQALPYSAESDCGDTGLFTLRERNVHSS